METAYKLKINIKSLIQLPKLSELHLEFLSQSHISEQELIQAITQNPKMTKQILKWVNSTFYGFSKEIKSIEKAVQEFGIYNIRNMIVAISIFNLFQGPKTGFDKEGFWTHAIGTAIASQILGSYQQSSRISIAFWAGFFHDIGKIMLDHYTPSIYDKIVATALEKEMLLGETEKIILGITHTQVGQWLAQEWRLPPELSEAIEFHHTPQLATLNRELVYQVHAADIFVRSIDIGFPGDKSIPKINEAVWNTMNFSEDKLLEILEKIDQQSEKAFDILL